MHGEQQWVAQVPSAQKVGDDVPRVEVVDGPLCAAADLQRAALAGALASGIVCALAGVGIGYLLGLRDGRED